MRTHALYRDRDEAGDALAQALTHRDLGPDPLVMALPRGGVPIGKKIIDSLGYELDLMLVRKLGHPLQPELAVGAIASGGGRVLNESVAEGVDRDDLAKIEAREKEELERREHTFRGDRPKPDIRGRGVVLVDDGIATGSTMRAAAEAVRSAEPAKVVIAVPLAPASSIETLEQVADEVICPQTPEPFSSIGQWYASFDQLTDEEVQFTLQEAWTGHSTT